MRIRLAVPEAHVNESVLNAALEASTRANEAMLASGEATPISRLIKAGKVKWQPENFKDGEHFDLSKTVEERGWGDCDDLAPAYAAELRDSGRDEGATAVVRKSGPKLWHAVTKLSDGTIKDPSKAAGMGAAKAPLVGSSIMGIIAPGGVLGLKPYGQGWASRCDLPISGTTSALCGIALGDSPLDAITGAVEVATEVGGASELCGAEEIARALAIEAACSGEDYGRAMRALDGYIDGEEVGEIFSDVARGMSGVIPAARAYQSEAGLAARGRNVPDGTVVMLHKQLVDIGLKSGLSRAKAEEAAKAAAKKAFKVMGVENEAQVGSFFGKILKSAVSVMPIPGAGLVANALPDINPFKGKGGGGGGGAAPGARPMGPVEKAVDWAMQIRRGVKVSRTANGAFMLQF